MKFKKNNDGESVGGGKKFWLILLMVVYGFWGMGFFLTLVYVHMYN